MKKKKPAKSGPKFRIKDAQRKTWNVSGDDAFWIEKQAKGRGLTESEFIRIILEHARNNPYAFSQAI